MPKSKITVRVVTFRPYYMGGCLAELVPDSNFTGQLKSDGHMAVPASYKVNLHRNTNAHTLSFEIIAHPESAAPTEKYFLVGVYFINRVLASPSMDKNVGRHVFKRFECNLSAATPTLELSITRGSVANIEKYEFMLVVQRESDGAVGIIDPEWENE